MEFEDSAESVDINGRDDMVDDAELREYVERCSAFARALVEECRSEVRNAVSSSGLMYRGCLAAAAGGADAGRTALRKIARVRRVERSEGLAAGKAVKRALVSRFMFLAGAPTGRAYLSWLIMFHFDPGGKCGRGPQTTKCTWFRPTASRCSGAVLTETDEISCIRPKSNSLHN